MLVRELFTLLRLDTDATSFAKGAGAIEAVKVGLAALVEVASRAVEAFKENITEALEYGDATRKASMAIGVESRALQELQYAAKLSDLSVEELNGGLAILTRTMAAAKRGGAEQAAAFKKAGAAYKNADGSLRGADEVLSDIAAKFQTMPDGADKTALAMQLFGRSGARMIPMLNDGAEGLAAMREEARGLGLVMGEDAQKASEEINDNLERLTFISKGLWRGAIAPLLPAISELVKQFLAWRKANAEVMRQRLQSFLSGVLTLIRFLGRAFATATGIINDAMKVLRHNWQETLVIMAAALAPFIVSLTAAGIAAIGTGLGVAAAWTAAAAPFLLITGLLAGVMLILDDIKRYHEGKSSVFGRFKGALNEWLSAGDGKQPWWLTLITDFVREMRNAIEMIDEFNAKNIKGFVGTKAAEHFTGGSPIPRNEQGGIDWWKSPSGIDWRHPFGGSTPSAPAAPSGGGGVTVNRRDATLNFNGPTNKETVDYAYEKFHEWATGDREAAAAALPSVE